MAEKNSKSSKDLTQREMISGMYDNLKDLDAGAVGLFMHDQLKLNRRFCTTADAVLGKNGGDGLVHVIRDAKKTFELLKKFGWVITICICTTAIGWLVLKIIEKLVS